MNLSIFAATEIIKKPCRFLVIKQDILRRGSGFNGKRTGLFYCLSLSCARYALGLPRLWQSPGKKPKNPLYEPRRTELVQGICETGKKVTIAFGTRYVRLILELHHLVDSRLRLAITCGLVTCSWFTYP